MLLNVIKLCLLGKTELGDSVSFVLCCKNKEHKRNFGVLGMKHRGLCFEISRV